MKQCLDFDVKTIQEVKEMKNYFDEISFIEDSNHTISFYSKDTNLSGMKAATIEIMSLLNIVDVESSTSVGDYPDPKNVSFFRSDIGFVH